MDLLRRPKPGGVYRGRDLIDSHSVVLDGHTYLMRHAETSVCLLAGARLINAAAPVFSSLGKPETFDRAINYIFAQPSFGEDLVYLARAFAPFTSVDGRPLVLPEGTPDQRYAFYELHFAGQTARLVKWLEAALTFDLSDFLGELSAATTRAKALVFAASTAPKDAAPTG